MPATIPVLQFAVSSASIAENAAEIIALANARQGRWICTLNLEMIGRVLTDPGYAALMGGTDLCVADGTTVLAIARLTNGQTPNGRTTGVDLVEMFLRDPACSGIGIIGGRDPVRALNRLQVDSSRVCYIDREIIAVDTEGLERLAQALEDAGCRLALVALGVPKQDIVCAYLRSRLPQLVVMGVGGSFEILGGQLRRAPRWMQNCGLEWLFRTMLEPRRLSYRFLVFCPATIARLVWRGLHFQARLWIRTAFTGLAPR